MEASRKYALSATHGPDNGEGIHNIGLTLTAAGNEICIGSQLKRTRAWQNILHQALDISLAATGSRLLKSMTNFIKSL